MKTVVLDGTAADGRINEPLRTALKVHEYAHFNLLDMDIRPCRSCGTCGHKTPGMCVYKDDMTGILKEIAGCEAIVFVTPITFGGYGSALKKAVDRLMVLGLPLYTVKKGRLLHPMRYGEKYLIVIGLDEAATPDSAESFRLLSANNAVNFGCRHQTVILTPEDSGDEMGHKISQALEEALNNEL